MHTLPLLIQDLAIMLGLAGIVLLLFQRTRQPVVLGYLVAGMLLGPHLLPVKLIGDDEIINIKILSELGVIFLMFSLGLEFSFHKLTKLGVASLVTGVLDVLFMLLLGYKAGLMLGWDFDNSIFLGASLAISSTTIIVKTIEELKSKTKRFAEIIFGVLIVEDLMAILLLVVLSTIATSRTFSAVSIVVALVQLMVVVGSWFVVGYSLVPAIFRRIANYVSQETLTVVAVALCLCLAAIASKFHYSSALGSFIMGSILAETILVKRIEEVIIPIRDIFGALFFITVGMLINPVVIWQKLPQVLFISMVLMCGKVLVISVLNLFAGQSINTSVRAGFGMAQIGEFSFIIATLGNYFNVINSDFYPIIVAVSSITTFTTPYMMRLSEPVSNFVAAKMPEKVKIVLANYASWVYRSQTKTQDYSAVKAFMLRLIINAVIVMLIFRFTHKFLFAYLLHIVGDIKQVKMLCAIFAMLLASPFVWGMLFSYKSKQDKSKMIKFDSVGLLVSFLTVLELVILNFIYFHTWVTTAILIIILMALFVTYYRHIGRSYNWFEKQLVGNIKIKSHKLSKYKELAPWDTHLVEMVVGGLSEFVAKSLAACKIRERFGINVVALQRGNHVILGPRGSSYIYEGDKLIVLGTDEQIDQLRAKVEVYSMHKEQEISLESFILKPLLIAEDSDLINKTIGNSLIREQTNGLVIGLERQGKKILNPPSDLVIEAHDLLLIVGQEEDLLKFISGS